MTIRWDWSICAVQKGGPVSQLAGQPAAPHGTLRQQPGAAGGGEDCRAPGGEEKVRGAAPPDPAQVSLQPSRN